MLNIKNIAGSLACFIALTTGNANANSFDYDTLNAQYVKHTASIQQYKNICQKLKETNLIYFILINNLGIDDKLHRSLKKPIEKVLAESKKRMRNAKTKKYDEMVYYSSLALYTIMNTKELIGGITIPDDFNIVDFGRGIDKSQSVLNV